MNASSWDLRIERARELANTQNAAAEILRFYAAVTEFQKGVYQQLQPGQSQEPEITALLTHFPVLLSLVKRAGPALLAGTAEELERNQAQWLTLLTDQDADHQRAFFARAMLQPYFEYQAGRSGIATNTVQPDCPFCGERPQVAVLRGEGDGGKRSLVCSLCATEWDFRRLLCPNCGEETERNLPVYVAQDFPHVRIEACDTCRIYIKSVDLTKNGLAVPVVEELATVALNLWAEEHQYVKRQTNLLGM